MDTKLIILSQGDHHIAVFKPHGMAVVGGPGVPTPTLLDLVRDRFGKNVWPVHRLDRVTAGITVFARSIFAKHALDNAFKKRLVKKIYYAICEGQPTFTKVTVDQPLKKIAVAKASKGSPAKQVVDKGGESAITNFRNLKQLDAAHCLMEANPLSGRMHQIRAHLAYLNLPVLGDQLYGASSKLAPHTIALCAVEITLPLPKGGRICIDARRFFEPATYIEQL